MKLRVLTAVFLISCLFPAAAAQEEVVERPWAVALSLAASFIAVLCSATAVLVMGVYPKTFWMLHGLSGALLLIAFSLAGGRGPIFVVAMLSLTAVILIVIAVELSKRAAKAVIGR